jgi:hypothetical protein
VATTATYILKDQPPEGIMQRDNTHATGDPIHNVPNTYELRVNTQPPKGIMECDNIPEKENPVHKVFNTSELCELPGIPPLLQSEVFKACLPSLPRSRRGVEGLTREPLPPRLFGQRALRRTDYRAYKRATH